MMRLFALVLLAPLVLAGCGQTQVVQQEKPAPVSADILHEADAFLGEAAPPQGVPFDAYAYQKRAARLMAALAGADPARADEVLRQTVKTVEAEAHRSAPYSFNSAEAELLKTTAAECHSLEGLRYVAARLSAARQHDLGLFEDLGRTFSPVLSQALEARQAEVRAAHTGPEPRVIPLAEAILELNRRLGGALVPGLDECLADPARRYRDVPLSAAEQRALAALLAKAPRSAFLDAARFSLEKAAAAAEEYNDSPLPPSPECIAFYRRVLDDKSLDPMWRTSVYWQAYHVRRLTWFYVATVAPDSREADAQMVPARALLVKAAALAAPSAASLQRRDIAMLLDELNTAPVTAEWKSTAAPLVEAWTAATKTALARERQFSATHRIDEHERDEAVTVLQSCLRLGDRAAAEWLLAEPAFLLGRWPTTYAVLAESPWPDLVNKTLAANAKDIEIVAWYPTGGTSPRMLMTGALRAAADRTIRAVQPPDLAHLAEALYAAMPDIGEEEEARYGSAPHFARVCQPRLTELAEAFGKLKFEDEGLRQKTAELLLARPTWWLLKDELFAWGARQKPADVCRLGMRDLLGGRLMQQYAACVVLLVNDGKPQPAMQALEAIRAEAGPGKSQGPRELLGDVHLMCEALLTVKPPSYYRAMPFPLARPAGDYVEFAKAVGPSDAVVALYAAAGQAEEIAKFSKERAAKGGSTEPLGVDLGVVERLLEGMPEEKRIETVGRVFANLEKAGINARAWFAAPEQGKAQGERPTPLFLAAVKKWWATQIEPLRKQVAENPADDNARGNLVSACEATGDFRGAIEAFQGWHGAPEDGGRWGRFLHNDEHAEEIGDALMEFVKKSPDKPWYRRDAAEAYLRAGRKEKAAAAVLEAFAAAPSDRNVQLYVMNVLMKSGDYKAAVTVGEKILALTPQPPQSAPDTTCETSLAKAYTELGRLDEAIAVYRRGLAVADPGSDLFIGLLHSTSDLLVRQGKSAEAVSLCQDGLRLTKDPERRLWIQGIIVDALVAARQQDKVIEAAGEGLRMCQPLPDSTTSSHVAKWSAARAKACLALKQYDEAMKMAILAQSEDLVWQIQEALLAEAGLKKPA